MIKVKNGVATREALPKFLKGVKQGSLFDLSWTDPELGVSDCAWWPEVDESESLGKHEQYGDEILTVDTNHKVVVVTHEIIPWTSEQIEAEQNTIKKACEDAIVSLIQSKVDAYNNETGLTFTDVKSCALYSQVSGYSHQAFCIAVWEWSVSVWEDARQILIQAQAGEITISGPEDVLTLLPEFVFNE